jgi:TatA/E family protein of Tat protein translocase
MSTLAFLENINGPEMVMIFLVVLLLFGAERLPGLFQSFGKSVREFKKATQGIEDDIRTAMDMESVQQLPPKSVTKQTVVAEDPPRATGETGAAGDSATEKPENASAKNESVSDHSNGAT